MQVAIHIQSRQKRKAFAEEPLTQVQTAEGTFSESADGFLLTYIEPDAGVGGQVSLAYHTSQNKLVLTRETKKRTVMVFKENVATICDYFTPFGTIRMNIHTKKINVSKQRNNICISFAYSLHGEGLDEMEIVFSMRIKPTGGAH